MKNLWYSYLICLQLIIFGTIVPVEKAYGQDRSIEDFPQIFKTPNPIFFRNFLDEAPEKKISLQDQIRLYPDDMGGALGRNSKIIGIPPSIQRPAIIGGIITDGLRQLKPINYFPEDNFDVILKSKCAVAAKKFKKALFDKENQAEVEANAYDKECFVPISKFPPILAKTGIEFLVGFLTYEVSDTEKAFCTALRLSKTKIITARHCFFTQKTGLANDYYGFLKFDRVKLYLVNDLKKSFSVTSSPSFINHDGPYPTSVDTIVLNSTTHEVDMPRVQFAQPEVKQKLITLGINLFIKRKDWRDQLRWSKGNSCFVVKRANRCIIHGCNTADGFSGAPVMALEPKITGAQRIIQVIGLHSSGGDNAKSCGSDLGIRSSNAAAPLEWTVIKNIVH